MKHMHVSEKPTSLINKRWTIDVKIYKQTTMPLEGQSKDVLNKVRYGSLNIKFNEISFYASKSNVVYWKLKGHLAQWKCEIKALRINEEGDRDKPFSIEKQARIVKDRLVIKTKCATCAIVNKGINSRKCRYYKRDGHTIWKYRSKNGYDTSVANFVPENHVASQFCYTSLYIPFVVQNEQSNLAGPSNNSTEFIWHVQIIHYFNKKKLQVKVLK